MRLATDQAVTKQIYFNHALVSVCGELPKEILDFGVENVKKNISEKNKSLLKRFFKEKSEI
jgi:hypothetical protein